MKGFKHTGRGPKMGHSFSSKAGFTHSGTSKQNVKGYTRSAPKKNFASGGMVTAPMASSSSALTRRTKPVTGFDAEAGGKGPLRPGFNKGGKACYAEGGKVETLGAAIRMVKQLMAQGNSASDAASKAARRYNVKPSQLQTPTGPTGGGGMPAEKQMLAKGGMAKAMGRVVQQTVAKSQGQPAPVKTSGKMGSMISKAAAAAAQGYKQGQAAAAAKPQVGMAPRGGVLGGPIKRAVGAVQQGFTPAPQGQKVPVATGRVANHGYGSFGRRPVVG